MLNKTNKYQTLLAVCLLTLSACSTNETLTDSPIDQSKTPIELTVGIVGENTSTPRTLTRTVTTDSPYGNAASAFSSATSLYMVMKSEHATNNTKVPKYTRTIGTVPGSAAESPLNVSFASGYERYWEDSYSRDSKVSVYSACIPGSNTALNIGSSTNYNNGTYTWSTDAITPNIAWPLVGTSSSASQDADFLTAQDLCFSNNVSSLPNPDNRIAFDGTLNKFTSKRLIFHHALTKVTFKIKKGDGFGTDPFAFANPTSENIILKGFNSSGTLDISSGDFSSVGTADISLLADTHTDADVTAGYSHVLTCLMLPGSALTSTATNEVYFTIDNNKYHITKSQLATALSGKTVGTNSTTALTTDSKMRPGVHYIFTLTVSKKGIDKLSASVVDWETTTADEITPTNARITVSLLDGTHLTGANPDFNLYRKASVAESIRDDFVDYNWATGYAANKATLTQNSTAGVYTAIEAGGTTPWYWPDNKTYYHFRAVMPLDHEVTHDNTDNYDYISLTGAVSYTDVCWGAPFKTTTGTLTYSTTYGFDNTSGESHQIYQAIGPTSETITLQIFHMMSDVTIQLTTTEGTDAVNLANAQISLSNIYPSGTVKLGNGLITPTGTQGAAGGTVSSVSSTYQLHYGFVPQSLTGVVLTITTTDNNQYKITMPERTATIANSAITNPYTETSSGSGKYTINAWYPNFQYTYTFKLTKTGVESISATIANWGTVTAYQETVVIQ